jgi:hypothetical protein
MEVAGAEALDHLGGDFQLFFKAEGFFPLLSFTHQGIFDFLEGLENDNLKILDQELQFEKERAEARKAEQQQPPEEAEPDGKPEGEGEAEEEATPPAEAEEGQAPDEGAGEEPASVRDWLGTLDGELRQELLEGLLADDGVKVRYRANDQDLEEPLKEVIRKAQGFQGAERVQQGLQESRRLREEAETARADLDQQREQLQAFQRDLVQQIDDPKRFAAWVSKNSDVEYLRSLRDELDAVVGEAESNPSTFNLSRQVSSLESLVRQLVQPRDAGPRGTPPRTAQGNADGQPAAAIPAGFGFQPGVGYPAPYNGAAWEALSELLQGSSVTPDQAAQEWAREGKKRPVFDVARELLRSRAANGRKADLAKLPPALRKPARDRATGKSVAESQQQGRTREVPWDQLEDTLAAAIQRAQQAGEL